MHEAIKAQFESRKAIAKQPFYQSMSKSTAEFYGDMYPVCVSYYHELNPAFLMQVSNMDIMNTYKALTVRDGLASFGSYVLKNFQKFQTLKTHLIISPELVTLLPVDSRDSFSCYQIVHSQSIQIQQAKKIIITGIASLDTVESLTKMKERLEVLKNTGPECDIEIFFPQRRNPLATAWRESFLSYEIIAYIREMMPQNKISFLSVSEILGQSSYKGYFCLDLLTNNLTVTDSYLNHYIASRGGTISTFLSSMNDSVMFEFDLSFYHRLQIIPFPKTESIFPELIFYKKQSATKDYMMDTKFHHVVLQK
jgi:hypothetical protein